MNKEQECEIVEDLLYAYNEKMLNPKSNEFVKNHLKNCDECTSKLEVIKNDLFLESSKEKEEEEKELEHLTKINRVIKILKFSLIVVVLLVLLFFGIILLKSKSNEYVINSAFNRLEELKKSDNYILTKEVIYYDYKNNYSDKTVVKCYYKDGKYKEIYPGTTFFFEDDSKEKIFIYDSLKQIEKTSNIPFMNIYSKGKYFESYTDIISLYNNEISILQKASLELRNGRFKGSDCYVIRKNANSGGYKNIWINKENFNTMRVEECYNEYYRDTIYDLIIDKTTDEDVTFDINDYDNFKTIDLDN